MEGSTLSSLRETPIERLFEMANECVKTCKGDLSYVSRKLNRVLDEMPRNDYTIKRPDLKIVL